MLKEKNRRNSKEVDLLIVFPVTFMCLLLMIFIALIHFTASTNAYLPLWMLLIIAWLGIFFFYYHQYKKEVLRKLNINWVINAKYIYHLITLVGTISGLYLTLLDQPLDKMSELSVRVPAFFVAILFGLISATFNYFESKEKIK
ncbi:hypothetical protein SSCS72_02916 [Mammaliicoccus sciuri]|uniref:hypothetical protein n=1 Tax=Mammaliicoccus sciuri TaxID=1296 RepID=UPI001EF4C753|nr:hypothetical protein [Mammaliicoccus sciuri]CAG7915095.1 hypothetical protein SSCS72_02916 [Mammaliicoccus sciuri]